MSATSEVILETGPGSRRAVLMRVAGATKSYHSGEVETVALRDANLEVLEGEMLVVVGPSGSGKSTLLNLLGGMTRPTSGTVRFRDQDLSQASDAELTEFRRRSVGFVFQFYNLVSTLTALENVQAVTEIADDPLDPRDALDRVGLSHRLDHFPSQLSGGEQQRVAMARALASNPPLLLCDEPTGALDLATSRQVLGILDRARHELGKTVVLITHNGALAGLADRVAVIRDGQIASVRENPEPTAVEEVSW